MNTRRAVADAMRPPLTTADTNDHVAAAAYLMKHARVTALTVLDAQTGQPKGILTKPDIARAVADGEDLNDLRIRELMTPGWLVRDDLAALPSDRFATGVSTRASAGRPRRPRPLPVSMPTTIPYYLGRPARVWIAAMPPGKSQPKTQHDDESAAWACTRQASAARSHPED